MQFGMNRGTVMQSVTTAGSFIAQAKYLLISRAKYWAHILSVCDLVEVDVAKPEWIASNPMCAVAPAMCNGRGQIIFVRSNMQDWTIEERIGLLAHELMHLVMGFYSKLGKRDLLLWNVAQDMAINVCLQESGFTIHESGVFPEHAGLPRGMTSDWYYDNLEQADKQPDNAMCGTGTTGPDGDEEGQGEGQEGDANAQARAMVRGMRNFAKAVQQANKDGTAQGLLPLLGDITEEPTGESKVDWKEVLYDAIRAALSALPGSDAARYGRTSAKQGGVGYGPGKPRLPAWHKRRFDVAFALDTSGSMGGILGPLQTELEAICAAAGGSVRFIQCDAAVGEDRTHRKGQKVKLTGGGGTDFRPVFDLIAKGKQPDVLVYATDGYGSFPDKAPRYATIWGIVGGFTGVPFGKEVAIDVQP